MKYATPSTFDMAEKAESKYSKFSSDSDFNFAAKYAKDLNFRYNAQINSDE